MDYFNFFKDFCENTSKKTTNEYEYFNERLKNINEKKNDLIFNYILNFNLLKTMTYDIQKLINAYNNLYVWKYAFAIGCIIGMGILNYFDLFQVEFVLPLDIFCFGTYTLLAKPIKRVLNKYNIKNEFDCDEEYKKLDAEIFKLLDKMEKEKTEICALKNEEQEIEKKISELDNKKIENEQRITKIKTIDYYLNEKSVKIRKRTVK